MAIDMAKMEPKRESTVILGKVRHDLTDVPCSSQSHTLPIDPSFRGPLPRMPFQ